MNINLDRFVETSHGVFGTMRVNGMSFYTVEEQNLQNQRSISCIPAGTYVCKRSRYHKGDYDTFEITNVPNRSRILFHVANTEEDVEGCVGVGLSIAVLHVKDEDTQEVVPKLAIAQSRLAFGMWFRKLTGVDEFTLTITDPKA